MEMEMEDRNYKAHVLLLPSPIQGHINPMLQLSKRLASKGLKVTLAITRFIHKSMKIDAAGSVGVDTISDGYDEDGPIENLDAYFERFKVVGSKTLAELIEKQDGSQYPFKCLVYDSHMPWALDVAKRFSLSGASFVTNSCAADYIHFYVYKGLLCILIEEPTVSIPGLPLLAIQDLPSSVNTGSYQALRTLILNKFSSLEQADWILFNTFDKLEDEVVNWMAKLWTIKTIGPTVLSLYLDKRMEGDKDYGLNLFKPNSVACMEWLNTKEAGSVVYVSFGSLAELGEEQMEELALGLKSSNRYFLWVVRASEENKLPRKFVEETSEKALVVTWCPQLEVLAHQAVGCFMTHCGWNSTLEALSLGVPMVAMPQWADQYLNAKFIVDVWVVGIRVKVDGNGLVRREEVKLCLSEVMEGEERKKKKCNAARWKDLAKEAVDVGGSSDKNNDEIVAKIICN